ncbi:MAG: rane protein [Akkermansiaceae bacterium]|nr:rane protein [Akkermansiaceae bacterium]
MENPFDPGRMRERWKWIGSDFRDARATQILVGLIVVAHIALSLGGGDTLDAAYLFGGLSRSSLMAGHVWQLLSYGFLHASPLHLLLNTLALLMAGLQLERIVGFKGLLRIFFAGVLAGGIAHVALQPAAQADLTLVGASGGIAAIFFWLITMSPDARSRFIPLSWKNLGRLFLAAQILLVASLWLPAAKAATPAGANEPAAIQVGHACHLGGSLAGWLLARRLLRPTVTRKQLESQRAKREARLAKERS